MIIIIIVDSQVMRCLDLVSSFNWGNSYHSVTLNEQQNERRKNPIFLLNKISHIYNVHTERFMALELEVRMQFCSLKR